MGPGRPLAMAPNIGLQRERDESLEQLNSPCWRFASDEPPVHEGPLSPSKGAGEDCLDMDLLLYAKLPFREQLCEFQRDLAEVERKIGKYRNFLQEPPLGTRNRVPWIARQHEKPNIKARYTETLLQLQVAAGLPARRPISSKPISKPTSKPNSNSGAEKFTARGLGHATPTSAAAFSAPSSSIDIEFSKVSEPLELTGSGLPEPGMLDITSEWFKLSARPTRRRPPRAQGESSASRSGEAFQHTPGKIAATGVSDASDLHEASAVLHRSASESSSSSESGAFQVPRVQVIDVDHRSRELEHKSQQQGLGRRAEQYQEQQHNQWQPRVSSSERGAGWVQYDFHVNEDVEEAREDYSEQDRDSSALDNSSAVEAHRRSFVSARSSQMSEVPSAYAHSMASAQYSERSGQNSEASLSDRGRQREQSLLSVSDAGYMRHSQRSMGSKSSSLASQQPPSDFAGADVHGEFPYEEQDAYMYEYNEGAEEEADMNYWHEEGEEEEWWHEEGEEEQWYGEDYGQEWGS